MLHRENFNYLRESVFGFTANGREIYEQIVEGTTENYVSTVIFISVNFEKEIVRVGSFSFNRINSILTFVFRTVSQRDADRFEWKMIKRKSLRSFLSFFLSWARGA